MSTDAADDRVDGHYPLIRNVPDALYTSGPIALNLNESWDGDRYDDGSAISQLLSDPALLWSMSIDRFLSPVAKLMYCLQDHDLSLPTADSVSGSSVAVGSEVD